MKKGGLPVRSVRWVCAAVFSLVLLAPAARATCGAEGCPFVREAFGVQTGRYAFDLRYTDVTQDALWKGSHEVSLAEVLAQPGLLHNEVELYTRTRSWVAEGRALIGDRLRVNVTLPYVDRQHRHALYHGGGAAAFERQPVDEWDFEGLGDATAIGQYRVFDRRGWPNVTLQGGVKLPTGRRHVPDETRTHGVFESALEPSARPGTGSTDWLLGALVSQPLPWKRALPFTASALMRFNTKGTDDFEAGDELQAGLSGGYAPADWLTLLGQANLAAHGSDRSAEASEVAHSAMRSLYLTPGLRVRVSPAISLYGLYQARVLGRSDEATVAGRSHFMFGTTYSLGR